jgi:iron(III) transport system substrate-binding protein
MRMAWQRRLPLASASVMALLLAAACGSSGPTSNNNASSKPQTQQELLAAANREGTVVWYTTFSSSDVAPMIAAFSKVYPKVKVQALRLSADQLPARVITEQRGGKYNADVVSGDTVYVSELIYANALAPYKAPDEAAFPAGLKLPTGYPGVVYVNTTVIAYNPAALKAHHIPVPKTFQDLTKPQWKGNFSIDPGAVNLYQALISSMGHTKALALIRALGNNSPRLAASHTLALTQVQSGEPMATATAYGYLAARLKKKTPGQIAFVNTNPLPTSLTLIDPAKNAPHPNAARLFIDWMESKTGQAAIVDVTKHLSLRNDVGNSPTVWDPSMWPPTWVGALPSAEYNTDASEYTQALHAS